jgi:RNA polymerase sigma-70 factor (ECF subfamily)
VENKRNSQQAVYELLAGYAMGVCEQYAESTEEAEEMAQEGFVKLFKNMHRFETDRHEDLLSSLKGWFKRILINTCIDQYRKNKRNALSHLKPEALDIQEYSEATPIDRLSYKELLQAVRLLSPGYRQVFNLFVLEGMSHEEISQQLGISVGTSKSNLAKAREKMKKILTHLTRIKTYV